MLNKYGKLLNVKPITRFSTDKDNISYHFK